MKYLGNCVTDIKIAYIGGGSRGWAWGLMSDLASAADISGRVDLYDIDYEAAKANEIIGNRYAELAESKSKWQTTGRETGSKSSGRDCSETCGIRTGQAGRAGKIVHGKI